LTVDDLVFTWDIPNFPDVQAEVLRDVAQLGKHSVSDDSQQISNTDWYLSLTDYPRPYIRHLEQSVLAALVDLKSRYSVLPEGMINPRVTKYWFQQYEAGDYHGWHIHDTLYAGVAFIELTEGAATQFSVNGSTFSVPVKEGQILLFPGVFAHCSPVNKTGTRKTAVAFNISG